MKADVHEMVERGNDATILVVLIHAYTLDRTSLNDVARTLRASSGFENADIYRPSLNLGLMSSANMIVLARDVLEAIDVLHQERQYKQIVLIGHSAGALLARKVYVTAWGETEQAPFEAELKGLTERAWSRNVTRIILLAGMNRGWRISYHLSVPTAFKLACGTLVGRFWEFITGKHLVIFQIRCGAPFLTQLRLQWLAMQKKIRRLQTKDASLQAATTVQLLGSIDDLVSPDDNIDLVAGRDFVYLDMPFSGHANVIAMGDPQHGPARAKQFRTALLLTKAELARLQVPIADYRPYQIDESVTHVIFVVHGIRDEGFWTRKIARRVVELGAASGNTKFGMATSSYGYFPMIPFLTPSKRREKVEWLMDQYAEATASFPNAEEFHCVAHSNGTYLIAKALEQYTCCRFKRIVFAGSVVRQDYDWKKFVSVHGNNRVEAVANYVATSDWVVAWFPKLFQILRLQDIGSAGHDGFDHDSKQTSWDRRFIRGGHGAALDERNWDAIARFVLTGAKEPPPSELQANHQSFLVKLFGYWPPLVWLAILLLLTLIGYGIYQVLPNPATRTAGLMLYALGIWKIVTRV